MAPDPASGPEAPGDGFSPLVRTILRSFRAADDVAMRALESAGFRGTGPAAWYLLHSIPNQGGLGVTKQAVGQALKELQREGYVIKIPDPQDRRALRVHATPEGMAVAEAGQKALEQLEARWGAELGRTRLKALRATMEEFCAFLEEQAEAVD